MSKYGQGLTVKWPAGIGENGSNAVLSTVKQSPGSIGYLELSYAKKAALPVASIQNRGGEFVVPSPESASLALNASIDVLVKDFRTPIVDPPATARGAYPITGMSFILIPERRSGSRWRSGNRPRLPRIRPYQGARRSRRAFVCEVAISGPAAGSGASFATDSKRPANQINLEGRYNVGTNRIRVSDCLADLESNALA